MNLCAVSLSDTVNTNGKMNIKNYILNIFAYSCLFIILATINQ